jgi:dephospho-CoA kinase
MTKLRIVAFTGPKGCGKDTAAAALTSLNEVRKANLFCRLQFAKPAKDIASLAFDMTEEMIEDRILKETRLGRFPFECPRQLVIDVANWYRAQYGGHVWAINWERRAQALKQQWPCFVIPDLRFPEEIEMLKRHNSLIVYIDRPEAEEALAAKIAEGDKMATNVSESHYAYMRSIANATILNAGSIESLNNYVHAVVQNSFGFWGHWEQSDQSKEGVYA